MNTLPHPAAPGDETERAEDVLSAKHLADLRKSGLSDAQVLRCGFRSSRDPAKVAKFLCWRGTAGAAELGSCLCIPFHSPDGTFTRYVRFKPDRPRLEGGKPRKYESPVGMSNRAYFPPLTRTLLADATVPLLVTEGEKKAAKADQDGFACVGLVGVYGWQVKREKGADGQKTGKRELIHDLTGIAWKGRVVFSAYDSDLADNPDVRWAEWHLAEALRAAGADVRAVRLPGGADGAKVGLDDFLVAHGADGLRKLIATAAPVTRPDSMPLTRSGSPSAGTRSQPYTPFPVRLLPEPVARFVEEASRALPCDPAYVALPALAVLSGAVGMGRILRIKKSWTEPPIVWTAVVGHSGTVKSPAEELATRPLMDIELELGEKYAAEMCRYQEEEEDHKKAKKDGTSGTAPPHRPKAERAVLSDVTIESLGIILQSNPKGVLVRRDELRGWFESFTRYSKTSDAPQWLELHRGGTLVIDRKTGDKVTVRVPHAAASVCGGIQPDILAQCLTREAFGSGLAARLLLAMPPRQPKKWTDAEIPDAVTAGYADAVRALRMLSPEYACGGRPIPREVPMSPEARREFAPFVDRWGEKTAGASDDLAAAFSKLEGYAARLALLHHLVQCVSRKISDQTPLGVDSLRAGIELADWFAAEAERVYSALGEDPNTRKQRTLAEFIIRRGGSMTTRDLQRGASAYAKADVAEAALNELAAAGWGSWVDVPPGPAGGRPTRKFMLPARANGTDRTDVTAEGAAEPFATIPTPETFLTDQTEVVSVSSAGNEGEAEVTETFSALPQPEVVSEEPPHVKDDYEVF